MSGRLMLGRVVAFAGQHLQIVVAHINFNLAEFTVFALFVG